MNDETKAPLTLAEVRILVIGDRVWGKAKTLEAALSNAGRPKKYLAFLVHHETRVDEISGGLIFPQPHEPIEFIRKGIK